MTNLENDDISYSHVSFEAEEQSASSSSIIDYKAIFDHSETFDSDDSDVYTDDLPLQTVASLHEIENNSDASFDENESFSELDSDELRNQTITFTLPTEEMQIQQPALFNISKAEWDSAEAFFALFPNAIKFDKKESKLNHSFVKVEDEIYAVHNRAIDKFPVPHGTNAKIKRVINRQEEDFGLRIEGAKNTNIGDDSYILRKLGILRSEGFRSYNKIFRSMKFRHPAYKHYTVFKYNNGESLDSFLKNNVLTLEQRIKIAIACCKTLRALQSKRIVHADLKPANLVINEKDGNYTIAMIDFGFAKELPPGCEHIRAKGRGSKVYMAPELKEYDPYARYSFESDIYAMGVYV